MIDRESYKSFLASKGQHLGEVRKNRSDELMNATFTGDIGYRKVYILDKDEGWKYEDAKFSKHAASSLQKDSVDSYLQFRPNVHYPIGTYVFIPDDTSYGLNINEEDPLCDEATNLWLIVQRTDSRQFVQYLVLGCDWKFRWVTGHGEKKKLMSCWGCHKSANSYTSGWWIERRVWNLDSLTSFWLPDTHYTYGDKLEDYGLSDTRTITHMVRTMISNNDLFPNCFIVSKIIDVEPQGVIKLSMKLDQFDAKRDNVNLRICDYYNDSGDVMVDQPEGSGDESLTSEIHYMAVNSDGELEEAEAPDKLNVGETYYWSATFSADGIDAQWKIQLIDLDDQYSEKDRIAIEKLMVLRQVNSTTVSLKPGKSNRIKGLAFNLIVSDANGDYESAVAVEVNI